jgi:hypothetical protein
MNETGASQYIEIETKKKVWNGEEQEGHGRKTRQNKRLTYSLGNSPNANEHRSDVLPHAPVRLDGQSKGEEIPPRSRRHGQRKNKDVRHTHHVHPTPGTRRNTHEKPHQTKREQHVYREQKNKNLPSPTMTSFLRIYNPQSKSNTVRVSFRHVSQCTRRPTYRILRRHEWGVKKKIRKVRKRGKRRRRKW